jgi:hypothetical protein
MAGVILIYHGGPTITDDAHDSVSVNGGSVAVARDATGKLGEQERAKRSDPAHLTQPIAEQLMAGGALCSWDDFDPGKSD